MVWVQQEYAAELAVLSAWIGVLLPWNITYSAAGGAWALFIRFPFFEFQYFSGTPVADGAVVRTIIGAVDRWRGEGLETATLVWAVGAGVMLAALVLSVLYYVNESRLEAARIHPVRLMGGLLGVAALVFGVATVFVWTGGFGGTPVPIGVVLLGLLAWSLLSAELTDDADRAERTG